MLEVNGYVSTTRVMVCLRRSLPLFINTHMLPNVKALETARTANRRLREEIKASAEELVAVRTQQGQNAKRHSQSLVAAKTALDEVLQGVNILRCNLRVTLYFLLSGV